MPHLYLRENMQAKPGLKSEWHWLSMRFWSESFWLDPDPSMPGLLLPAASQGSASHKTPLVQRNSCTTAKAQANQQQHTCLTITGSLPLISRAQACTRPSNCCPIMFSGCSKVKGSFVQEPPASLGWSRLASCSCTES